MDEYFKEKVVIIVGGAGLIGSHLTRQFLEVGKQVIVIDNFSTGLHSSLSSHPSLKIIDHDIAKRLPQLPPSQVIFHLASPACPKYFSEYPQAILDANDLGTRRLIDEALKNHATLIFASSSEIYGELKSLDYPEGIPESAYGFLASCTNRSCYAAAKRIGEELIWTARRMKGLMGISIRLFNVYGPNMDLKPSIYGRVIPNYIRAALQNKPLLVHGDGTQIRSFCWIQDVVRALMMSHLHVEKLPSVLNIGRSEPISILELARKIIGITKSSSKIVYVDKDPYDPIWRCPDISQAKQYLDWHPKVSLEEGLKYLIKTEQKNKNQSDLAGGFTYN